ncbi:MAG: MGMT family protein [Candidatus Kapabacteria bacterium]|nr:MGMT family protein [Ignavibacteriota bacterium]MCW5884804.1 MGMT family protein [Candidatus Kapabacteria bacterium]
MNNQEVGYFERVYEVVRRIPYGRVTTYGLIAEHLGLRSGARMVGWALNADRQNLEMPYHRVVNRLGELSGARYYPTPTMMRELLESEGITFIDKAVDIKKYLWKP